MSGVLKARPDDSGSEYESMRKLVVRYEILGIGREALILWCARDEMEARPGAQALRNDKDKEGLWGTN